jgi:hypothetical protein
LFQKPILATPILVATDLRIQQAFHALILGASLIVIAYALRKSRETTVAPGDQAAAAS